MPTSVAYDPFIPVLKSGTPSLHLTTEQDQYVRDILDISCSDSAFAKKAYKAIQLVLTAGQPAPSVVDSLAPPTAVIGDVAFDVHVHGTDFTEESVIVFNGIDEPTTFVSNTELTTGVNMPLWTVPVVVPVLVRTNTVESNSVNFEFLAPV